MPPGRDTKARLHSLIDNLPEAQLESAERFLEFLRATSDPFLRALFAAPMDDELESEGERAAVVEARTALRAGDIVPDEEVEGELKK